MASTIVSAPPARLPAGGEVGFLRRGWRWLDEYTSPRSETNGNLESPSYFQAGFNGGADGLYLFGPWGIVSGAGSAAAGIAVQKLAKSQTLGVAAGALVGGALGVAITTVVTGGAALPGAVGGALLGAFETLRGDARADRRDASNMFSTIFLSGPAKLAGSFGAMIGAHFDNPWVKTGAAAAIGAATGAAVAALVPGTVGIATAALISGVGAGIGPVMGARLSQFLRNFSQDFGKGIKWVARSVGLAGGQSESTPSSSKLTQTLGAIPVSFAREGMRAFFMSDGSWMAVVAGGLKESARQCHIIWASHRKSVPPPAVPAVKGPPRGVPDDIQ